jgi:hypothetical protein
MKNRNEDVLADFVAYCENHPQERFWQALRNWSDWPYVMVTTSKDRTGGAIDTFYWEGRSGCINALRNQH